MTKLGLYLDATNLYWTVKEKYRRCKVDYKAYIDTCLSLGKVSQANVYSVQDVRQSAAFRHSLQGLGFRVHMKQAEAMDVAGTSFTRQVTWNCGIITHAMADVFEGRIDTVVVGSSDESLSPMIRYLRMKNVPVIIFACNVPPLLTDVATEVLEITSNHLIKGR
jgi:uncharacterized LabA/DUF88 family protein